MTGPTNRDSALARVLSEEEVSRKLFLKGGGALVLGLSTAGCGTSREQSCRALRDAHRCASRAAECGPDRFVASGQPRQLRDALPRLGGDGAGIADGGADDRGRGARDVDGPGGRGADRHERVAFGVRRRQLVDADGNGCDEHARRGCCGADAAPEPGLGAARRSRFEPLGLERRRLRRRQDRQVFGPDGREAVQQHDRGSGRDADEPGELQGDRHAGFPASTFPTSSRES